MNEDEQKRAFKAPISGTVYGTNCESHHQAVQLSHLVSDGNAHRDETVANPCDGHRARFRLSREGQGDRFGSSFPGLRATMMRFVGSQRGRSSCVGFVQVSRDALPVEASSLRVLWAQDEDEQDDWANDRYQSEEVTSAAAVRVVKTTPDQGEARH